MRTVTQDDLAAAIDRVNARPDHALIPPDVMPTDVLATAMAGIVGASMDELPSKHQCPSVQHELAIALTSGMALGLQLAGALPDA